MTARLNRHLAVLLALLGLSALAVAIPRRSLEAAGEQRLTVLPWRMDGWEAAPDVPAGILPHDPRALEDVRRTYRRGTQQVWLSAASFPASKGLEGRPDLDLILPAHDAYETGTIAVRLGSGGTVPVREATLGRSGTRRSVAYWYQVGDRAMAGEYRLRGRLFLDAVRNRPRSLVLIRVVTERSEDVGSFIRDFYPHLLKVVAANERGTS